VRFNIAVLPGDGVGPEVTTEGVKVLEAVGKRIGHSFNLDYAPIGGVAIDKSGVALPQETLAKCKKSDAVFLGAVGGPKWDDPRAKVRPEDGLLGLRKQLKLFRQPASGEGAPHAGRFHQLEAGCCQGR